MRDSFVHTEGLTLAKFEYGSAKMQRLDGSFVYSASDLNDYLECQRLTELESLVALNKRPRPEPDDERAKLIRRKGEEHEQLYLEGLIARHPGEVVQLKRSQAGAEQYREADAGTLAAMQSGVRFIYQATFFDGLFIGHADFLERVEKPSGLGSYGYEVIDTKLALAPKAYYLVQLCNYSEHLERLQGCLPEFGHVVFGNGEAQRFPMNDYMAYYRHLKSAFLRFVDGREFDGTGDAGIYPLKRGHCDICPWDEQCASKRAADDHLSLVARMRRDQIAKFEGAGIERVTQLGAATDEQRPAGMNPESFVKLRRQASLQVRGRDRDEPIYELLRHEPPLGFALLPLPSPGDVFFDMEGDPLYEPGRSLEYLFGCWVPGDDPPFRAFWGLDRAGEKRAFEEFVDFVMERRERYPASHIYHYASYEKSALRRLAQAHCTREDEIDVLLRGEVLVDLYAVVRQALAISEDGYGLKKVERLYKLERETDVRKGDQSIVMFELWLLGQDERILKDIENYNQDDCRSTHRLRDWLLERRVEAVQEHGVDLPLRPVKAPLAPCHVEFTAACKTCVAQQKEEREAARRSDLERALLSNTAAPQSEDEYRSMAPQRRRRYLMAALLAYHRREEKPEWWAFFDRCENLDGLLEFDREAIGGLKLCEDIPPREIKRSAVYTYAFPEQHHKLGPGDDVHNPRAGKTAGAILSLDDGTKLLELKTTASIEEARAVTELIPCPPPPSKVQRDALARIAESFLEGNLFKEFPATDDLLANREPRARGDRTLQPDVVNAKSVCAAVAALDNSYLFIQGPPGSGKSTYGSQVICDLLERGRRVAVTSNSHRAIHNLLRKVDECTAQRGGNFRGRYKHTVKNSGSEYRNSPFIESHHSNEAFSGDDYQLAGGTSWLFTREELTGKFDYLFVDEAGQVALADALALSTCARNVVLLGDPSQLAQVGQGQQPLHAGDSILEHLLGDDHTVAPDRGIFLDVSYRMQPEICDFISETMYDGRLRPADSTREHRITLGARALAGLYCAPVSHAGNGSSSEEEADAIVEQIASLRRRGMLFDSKPPERAIAARPVSDRDIIVVTPYNAQRRLIQRKLRSAGFDVEASIGIEVGTVDKFQGQEAPIVFYSMATSSGEEMPRSMGFLFERNRFNVAISRARALSVLVYSPRLLDIPCRSPEEMALANLLCAFVERANPWPKGGLDGESDDGSAIGSVEFETSRGRP